MRDEGREMEITVLRDERGRREKQDRWRGGMAFARISHARRSPFYVTHHPSSVVPDLLSFIFHPSSFIPLPSSVVSVPAVVKTSL